MFFKKQWFIEQPGPRFEFKKIESMHSLSSQLIPIIIIFFIKNNIVFYLRKILDGLFN
jgi:hypothetical protein